MMLARLDGETLGHGGAAVLPDVTLGLSAGERLVLLGRSGSGKTTLLNALHERLMAGGHRVALAPQDYALVPQLSVLRNTLMGRLDDHGAIANLVTLIRPGRARRAEAAPLLDRLGLGGLTDRPVQSLSGGQRQRTALARALYRGGAVLIADEPVSAVDETQAEALLALMGKRFPTSVLALHDVALARAHATRLIGLRAGRIAFDAPPAAVDPAMIEALYAA